MSGNTERNFDLVLLTCGDCEYEHHYKLKKLDKYMWDAMYRCPACDAVNFTHLTRTKDGRWIERETRREPLVRE